MKRKLLITAAVIIQTSLSFSQYVKGMNYLKVGGVQFNKENKEHENYLPLVIYTDSTQTDSLVYAGSSKSDLTLAYHIAITDHLIIGVTSRFLQSKESSYIIKCGGVSLRYAFPLKIQKFSESQFVLNKNKAIVRNFFFVDYTGLFGNLKYDQFSDTYISHSLQGGISLRVPTPDVKFIRHLGLEISGGINYRTMPYNTNGFFPIANAGIQYYFDRNYTKVEEKKKKN